MFNEVFEMSNLDGMTTGDQLVWTPTRRAGRAIMARIGRRFASTGRLLASLRANRRLAIADTVATALAALAALLLTANLIGAHVLSESLVAFVSSAVLAALIMYPLSAFYRGHARATSLRDAVVVVRGALFALGLQWLCLSLLPGAAAVPFASFAIQFLVVVPALVGLRLCARHRELVRKVNHTARAPADMAVADTRIPVLVVGTGTNCDLFVRASRTPDARYRPIGIIDDARDTGGLVFHDIDILGSLLSPDRLCATLEMMEALPQRLFLTEPITQLDSDGIGKLIGWANAHSVPVSRLPNLGEAPSGSDLGGVEPRAVDPTDILDRPQKAVERSLLRALFNGRRVLITGAGGSIGSELSRQIASFGPSQLVLLEQCELNAYTIDQDLKQYFPDVQHHVHVADIRDARRVNAIFAKHRPELVFNAAALKHVPMVEANPCEGVLTNVIGTRNIADAARDVGAIAMVQVSTDKAVNTTNVMGATKRVAEFYVQAQDRITSETGESTRFFSVRFGNVLGSSGSLIPLFQKQIAQGGPLTITDDRMTRYFMTIREAVELTLVAAAKGLAQKTGLGQIFVLDMGEPVKIMDIAERMIRLAGLRPDDDIKIEVIGIRPGEKLFEELFDESETPRDCGIPGVQAAVPDGIAISRLRAAIHHLEGAARGGSARDVKRRLKNLVPGYGVNGLRPIEITGDALRAPEPRGRPIASSPVTIALPTGGYPSQLHYETNT